MGQALPKDIYGEDDSGMKWTKHPIITAGCVVTVTYLAFNSLFSQPGTVSQYVYITLNEAFGTGRICVVALGLWAAGCLFITPKLVINPLRSFMYYLVNASVATVLFPSAPLGDIIDTISNTITTRFGTSGIIFIAIFFNVIPFVGLIENYIKKEIIPEIEVALKGYVKQLKPKHRLKSAAPMIEKKNDWQFEQICDGVIFSKHPTVVALKQPEPSRQIGFNVSACETVSRSAIDTNTETAVKQPLKQNPGETAAIKILGEVGDEVNQDVINLICQLRKQNISLRKIGERTGLSYSKVYRILSNLNDNADTERRMKS